MNDTIYGALIGCGATIIGTLLSLGYQHLENKKKEKILKAALLDMFIASVISYKEALNLSGLQQEWNSSFWNRCQLEVAKYFPKEAVEFNDIIFRSSSFLRGINRANCLTRLTNLLAALSTAKAKNQQTYTKTLLRWLEKTLSKI